MATYQGTVISVEVDTQVKKNGGGTYNGWELIYKDRSGEVRTTAKHMNSLKYNAALAETLNNLNAGDQFAIELQKNDAGFNDVIGITLGWDATSPAPATRSATPVKKDAYVSPDARQTSIVRQSSLAQAVATLAIGSKSLGVDKVLEVAAQYEEWVNRKEVPKLDGKLEDPNAFDEDVPL